MKAPLNILYFATFSKNAATGWDIVMFLENITICPFFSNVLLNYCNRAPTATFLESSQKKKTPPKPKFRVVRVG